VAEKKTDFH